VDSEPEPSISNPPFLQLCLCVGWKGKQENKRNDQGESKIALSRQRIHRGTARALEQRGFLRPGQVLLCFKGHRRRCRPLLRTSKPSCRLLGLATLLLKQGLLVLGIGPALLQPRNGHRLSNKSDISLASILPNQNGNSQLLNSAGVLHSQRDVVEDFWSIGIRQVNLFCIFLSRKLVILLSTGQPF